MSKTLLDPENTFFTTAQKKTATFGFKAFLVVILLLVLLIPLGFVSSIVRDRQHFKNDAVESILSPIGGELTVNGLSLIIECFEPREWTERQENGQIKTIIRQERSLLAVSPASYNLLAETATANLTRGIFSVPTYRGTLHLEASFTLPDHAGLTYTRAGMLENRVFISFSLNNNKNLVNFPAFTVNGALLERMARREPLPSQYANDIQFELPSQPVRGSPVKLDGTMAFQGGNAIHFAPLAGDSVFTVRSDWKTPGFSGGWLPAERDITENGFSARWQIAGISTSVDPLTTYTGGEQRNSLQREKSDFVTVRFFTPVESYQKTERSIKYALLFLLVPFLTIFLFEIFMKKRIHPVQYCLVGLANIIFYLLLLSISEHLSFNFAYLLAAVAVTLLTSAYIGSILRSLRLAGVIALIQGIAYVFLFGTLQAEDYALLIGTLGLFAVVAVLMLITRKIDWYGTESQP